MGIPGLLPLLSQVSHPDTPLSSFSHSTIGIDGHVWLHRAAYSCAQDIGLAEAGDRSAQSRASLAIAQFFVHRLIPLKSINISPYIVLDGKTPPLKSKYASQTRQQVRGNASELAHKQLKLGNLYQANRAFQSAISIHRWMVQVVVRLSQLLVIPYLVAPYEADAQLVYLERIGIIDSILTEDSDLLILGARTLLLKLNPALLTCTLVNGQQLFSHVTRPCSLLGWGLPRLVDWAILSGCDFVPGLPGIGIKRAYSAISSIIQFDSFKSRQEETEFTGHVLLDSIHPSLNPVNSYTLHSYRTDSLSRALSRLPLPSSSLDHNEYHLIALRARLAFRHPRVWCPISHTLVCLFPWPSEHNSHYYHPQSDYSLLGLSGVLDDTDTLLSDILGPWHNPNLAYHIAIGQKDPITLNDCLPTLLLPSNLHILLNQWNQLTDVCKSPLNFPVQDDQYDAFVEFGDNSLCSKSSTNSPIHPDCHGLCIFTPEIVTEAHIPCPSSPLSCCQSDLSVKFQPKRNLFQVQLSMPSSIDSKTM